MDDDMDVPAGPPGADYVAELRRMLRDWGWPDWEIETALPKVVDVMLGAGLLERTPWGYEPTPKAGEEEAWKLVWKLLAQMGIAEDIGPAS